MVGVEISGRLGNQMFEYAFAYAEAKKHRTMFFFIKEGAPLIIYEYFKLETNIFYVLDRLFFNTDRFSLLFSHYLRRKFYDIIKKIYIRDTLFIGSDEDPLDFESLQNKTLYKGHFQSQIYFRNYANEIRDKFQIKKKFLLNYKKKYNHPAGKKIIAIHIRKADYLNLSHLNLGKQDLSLPLQYFKKIIESIHEKNNFYIFVSDDIELIKPHFGYLEKTLFSNDVEIHDFLHLLFADTVIISNSTFSWWAAYLNSNPNKVVYCPKYFLGYAVKREHPMKIYPEEWHQIDVD